MTIQRDLKRIIRRRQKKTGESYTAARAHVMRAQSEILGLPTEDPVASEIEQRLEAVVLKVGSQSARIHIPGEDGQLTLRSGDVFDIVPGHIITFAVKKRWTFRGHAYASGRIEDRRIDAASLGLDPLPLNGGELINLRTSYEPYRSPDPYEPLWRKLTARRRASYEMDPIAWGAFPDSEPDASLVGDASDLIRRGDIEGGRDLLMAILLRDLRCIDAHGHLGNLEFDRWPERALVHSGSGSASASCRYRRTSTKFSCGAISTTARSSDACTARASVSGASTDSRRRSACSSVSCPSTPTTTRASASAGTICITGCRGRRCGSGRRRAYPNWSRKATLNA